MFWYVSYISIGETYSFSQILAARESENNLSLYDVWTKGCNIKMLKWSLSKQNFVVFTGISNDNMKW